MSTRTLIHTAAAAALLTIHSAHAQPADATPQVDPHYVAQAYMAVGQGKEACDTLAAAYGTDTADPEILFLFGQCSSMQGRHNDAIRYYERLVAAQPDAARPKLELAQAYQAVGRTTDARALYAEVLQLNPPETVVQNIERMIEALDAGKPWRASVYAGVVWDSNVNAGPVSPTMEMILPVVGRQTVSLTRPEQDWGAQANGSLQYFHDLGRGFGALAQGSVATTRYFDETDLGNDNVAVSAGLVYRVPAFTASLSPAVSMSRVDDDLERVTYGVTGRATVPLTDRVTGLASAGWQHADSKSDNGRDANSVFGALGAELRVGKATVTAEYTVRREDAEAERFDSVAHGPSLAVNGRVHDKVTLQATYRYTATDHEGVEPIFGVARDEGQHQAGVTALIDLSQWTREGVVLRTGYSYTFSNSNLEPFEHRRQQATLGIQFSF